MTLSPDRIRQVYENAAPYQRADLMKYYVGEKIVWKVQYASVNKRKDNQLAVLLWSESDGSYGRVLLQCIIKETDFPIIRTLPVDTILTISGKIGEINDLAIYIQEAQLRLVEDQDRQIFFPAGSRQNFLTILQGKILGAKNIKICDPYPDKEILKLLECSSPGAIIQLLGNKIESSFPKMIEAFNNYFEKKLECKKSSVSHARFYIIDGNVFQVDSSLKNNGGDKATTIICIDNESLLINEFDEWWDNAASL